MFAAAELSALLDPGKKAAAAKKVSEADLTTLSGVELGTAVAMLAFLGKTLGDADAAASFKAAAAAQFPLAAWP